MKRYLNNLCIPFILFSLIGFPASAQLVLTTYTGQTEITAPTSVTLRDPIHIVPTPGTSVRIYTTGVNTIPCAAVISGASSNQNYISTKVFKRAGFFSAEEVNKTGLNVCEVNQTIQYFDGLGRPVQTVQVQGSPEFNDIILPITYDAFGREAVKYDIYTQSSNGGGFRPNALTEQDNFYASPPQGVKQNDWPLAISEFENSPLNRVRQQGFSGTDWQIGSGHTVRTIYSTNVVSEVKLWRTNTGGASSVEHYSAGRLYKTTVRDENWVASAPKTGTTEEFKDLAGRTVLKKIWESETNSLSTYYVYDDLGNLAYVLPPAVNEGTDRLPSFINSFTEADDVFKNFIYGYHFDNRNRPVEKKVPGKDWEFLVYNHADQIVLTQDKIMRNSGQWQFSKYDAFGRVIITGLYTDSRARFTIQNEVNDLPNDPLYKAWEVRNNNNSTGTGTGYSNTAFPTTATYYHGFNYYDDYFFYNNTFGLPSLPQVGSERTKTLLTGTRTTVLGTGTMLLTTNYYDADGRIIHSKSENHLNGTNAGTDVVNNEWNFDGSLKTSSRVHVANGVSTTIANEYVYDHVGRKKATKSKINSGDWVTLSNLSYNEIGQLISKGQHSTDGVNFLQSIGYTYNERGWLTGQNSGLFNFSLGYNSGSTPQYNGNISTQSYTNGGAANAFSYSYDKLNRLIVSSAGNGLGENITYDVMGNIKSLYRDNWGTNDYHIDQYQGNQLKSISGFTNGSYVYNENGNLISDGPNGNSISYNYLNLPQQVSGNQNVTYTYDATGNKLKKVSSSTGTTDYVGGIVYHGSGIIDFIQTEEGIARNSGGAYSYEYNQMDHLGNVRLSFKKNPVSQALEPLQRDDYYAFGLRKVAIGGTNKYLYNGKELQEELGQYDYGARFYDPVIARFTSVDPHAASYPSLSGYSAFANNPINVIDPDGRDIIGVTKKDAQNFRDDVYKVLADDRFAGVRSLISVKGSKFNKVDGDALAKAMGGITMSADEKAYVDMVTNTINSKTIHKVEYINISDDVSLEGGNAVSDHFKNNKFPSPLTPDGTLKAATLSIFGGEGFNVPTEKGSHSMIISGVAGGNTERAVTSGHEVFGHGIPSARREGNENNNNNAIRTDNLIRRILGLPQRDGKDHAGGPQGQITDPRKLPYTQ
ncbi:DUF6443 domain-containing protein [Pedobacter rhizosphaerae]|uniref:RHS repeat-associated core domain-containing protein n=1 Tax=Pedobacter rhizosphaerae TaxID=390241 RepID=A0A1H9VEU2_9SPHI|nr:DUF6443 domain-containing protein [Pedobacter rhizosphaerae]SES20296.1 RHS repeat-associated core domain-containing protein [Pedobacter rhizosphaerae]